MRGRILTLPIRYPDDLVLARQRAREISSLLGFDELEQARIASAASEIARNALNYAGEGELEFGVQEGREQALEFAVRISDKGPGIADLDAVLARGGSAAGRGSMGILSARRLMDRCEIQTAPGAGTTVLLAKRFPRTAVPPTAADLLRITGELGGRRPSDALDLIREHNQELLRATDELRARQEELERLNRELEDTNRGVVALYAELDDKADHLRRADELKSRFLSNMSHEFRTPLNSILALSRILLDRVDGDLTEEQSRQVTYIQKNAQDLSELVNDLLDLAKVEAGRISVNAAATDVENLFGGLRGIFRPLLINPQVSLVFEEPEGVPPLYTDEGKISQILRNFISNALKFTESGEVRVRAHYDEYQRTVTFSVSDTGIGIAPEFHQAVFEEFSQVDSALQRRVKGTGLGLPLARRLAELLGGWVALESAEGRGSTFSATIPARFEAAPAAKAEAPQVELDPSRLPLLVVEDHQETALLYEKYVKGSGYQVIPVSTVAQALEALAVVRPAAIVLDILLPGENAWEFLVDLKRSPTTADIPVLVVSVLEEHEKGKALGAEDYCVKPLDRRWLLDRLRRVTARQPVQKALVVDDDEVSRYLLKDLLADTRFKVVEAGGGMEGLQRAQEERPGVILLDLLMPDLSGFEVLNRLHADAATRDIPVVVVTSKVLSEQERKNLLEKAAAVVSKNTTSRPEAVAELRAALKAALTRTTPEEGTAPHAS
jgi:signal transduction histidine kinase/CheY-like chemotaxis protein